MVMDADAVSNYPNADDLQSCKLHPTVLLLKGKLVIFDVTSCVVQPVAE